MRSPFIPAMCSPNSLFLVNAVAAAGSPSPPLLTSSETASIDMHWCGSKCTSPWVMKPTSDGSHDPTFPSTRLAKAKRNGASVK
ncbi:hypothetical protein TIFTF001_026474 [Ficus carica]|uniref:Uncharacterized protein n=1 Tax=Ficus carica TaxID=3494 RepID=A0AA88DLG8_FICCA|nr:hypothetical protein TIFTF001_026474 [Ficus carica]